MEFRGSDRRGRPATRGGARRARIVASVGAVLVTLLGAVAIAAPPGANGATAGCDPTVRPDAAALNAAFARPGLGANPFNPGYAGGDYPHAYPLPDGRILWLFQDQFFSADDDLRDTPDTAAHNAGLVQTGACWQVLGGRGLDLIGDDLTLDGTRWWWPLDGEIGYDGQLWVFMAEMYNGAGTGAGPGTTPMATWIARLDPDTLRVLSFERAPDRTPQLYGWSVVSDGRYSYLYGHCYRQYVNDVAGPGQFDSSCMPSSYLARVPLGHFDAAPDYWTGTGWSGDPDAARPVFTRGAANPMSVQWFGDVFVSVTKIDDWWGSTLFIDRAPSPAGPWGTVAAVPVAGLRKCQAGCGNYGAFLAPWLDSSGKMTVALSNGADFALWRADASLYRPSFLTFAVPGAATPSAAAPPAFPTAKGSAGFLPVDPVRVLDTRTPGANVARLTAGASATLDLSGIAPPGTTAVALNLTSDRTTTDGWIRLFPCSQPEPATSNLNPARGVAITNSAIVPFGDGRICITSQTDTDLLVDLNGWLTTASDAGLVPVTARRVVDTRVGTGAPRRLTAGEQIEIDPGAAAGATAVSLNVTAVDPGGDGFVTVWPCGIDRPTVSSLNPQRGVTRPNLVNVKLGTGGKICVYTNTTVDVLVDVLGEYRPGAPARYASFAPRRLLDTRIDDKPIHPSNDAYVVPVPGGVAAQANVTVTGPRAAGYLTAYPCLGQPWPGTSNVNFAAGETAANSAVITGSRGYACLDPSVGADVIVDVFGAWT